MEKTGKASTKRKFGIAAVGGLAVIAAVIILILVLHTRKEGAAQGNGDRQEPVLTDAALAPGAQDNDAGASKENMTQSSGDPELGATEGEAGKVKAEVIPDEEDSCIEAEGEALMNMDIETLSVLIPGNDEAAQKIMDAFLELKEECYGDARDFLRDMDSPSPEDGMFTELKLNVCRTDQAVISVYCFETVYLGGSHPIHGIFGKTFSTETGEELQLAELTEDKALLVQALHDECWEQANQPTANGNGYSEVADNAGGFDSLFASERFVWTLDLEGIHIYLPEYSVVSYFGGIVEFVVPYDSVEQYVYAWVIPD